MKKGSKRDDLRYFLEIRDLKYNPLYLHSGVSLREAVRLASEYVTDMHHHSKVYRELRSMHGAYIGLFYAPQGLKKAIKAFVLIQEHSAPTLNSESALLIEAEQLESDIAAGKIKTRIKK